MQVACDGAREVLLRLLRVLFTLAIFFIAQLASQPVSSSGSFASLTSEAAWAQSAERTGAENGRLAGYSADSSKTEREWEKKLRDGVLADNLRQSMQRLSARPHHVGSPYDKDNAEWILGEVQGVGI